MDTAVLHGATDSAAASGPLLGYLPARVAAYLAPAIDDGVVVNLSAQSDTARLQLREPGGRSLPVIVEVKYSSKHDSFRFCVRCY
jgi:hypothetical protein